MQGGFPTDDEARAYAVAQTLDDFVKRFHERTTDPDALERVLEGETFKGGVVRQAPEFFTEQYLVIPLLEALNYSEIRRRPVDLTKAERKEPDLQVFGCPPGIVCIAEVTALGRESRESRAAEQVNAYLQDDTFVKYATDFDQQYLVGIGTDGVEWMLYAKPVGQKEPIRIGGCSLLDELRTFARDYRVTTDRPESLMKQVRSSAEELLVPLFARHNLKAVVEEEVNHRYP